MKIVRFVPMTTLGLFVLIAPVCADPAGTDPEDNAALQTDADGVPISISQGQQHHLSADEISALRRQQQLESSNKDWLVRSYEEQQKNNSANSTSSNLYDQLRSNKELARLAGLPVVDDDSPNSASANASNPGTVTQDTTPDNPDHAPADPWANPSRGMLMKPFISPLGATGFAGMNNNYFSSLSTPLIAPLGVNSSPQRAAAAPPPVDDSLSELDMPGAVSSDKNSTLDQNLDLDVLPGESIDHARAHQDNDALLQLPQAMDADELHKEQAASLDANNNLALPGQKPTVAPATTTQAAPIVDPSAPIPVSKLPQINPVRPAVPNPFDILDR